MAEFKLYTDPWNFAKLFLGSSLFVGAGIWMLQRPDVPLILPWCCILFFGLGMLVALYQLLDRRPRIIINELGIFDRNLNRDFINWELIEDAYLGGINGQVFLCLVLNQPFAPSGIRGKWYRKTAGWNRAMGFQELNMHLGAIKIDAERLMELILLMRTAEKGERRAFLEKGLPA